MKMQQANAIPAFIIEEHHEAFLIWHYALINGLLTDGKKCLLHIDEHSDMSIPRLDTSLDALEGNLESIRQFTYAELSIANFVLAAVYQELINEVVWVRQKHRHADEKKLDMFVSSCNDLGKKLLTGRAENQIDAVAPGIKTLKRYRYTQTTISQLESIKSPFLLDIDLDYFSCIQNPYDNYEIEIEITEKEFLGFQGDLYHRLRFITSKLEAIERGGKYYYLINSYKEVYDSHLKVSDRELIQRVKSFFAQLSKQPHSPELITICRSRFSGFTPVEQWELIEAAVLEGLDKLYGIDVQHIQDMQYV